MRRGRSTGTVGRIIRPDRRRGGCGRSDDGDDADDGGQVLVMVMVLAVMIVALSAVAVNYSVNNLSATGNYSTALQSRLAAETGLNVMVSQIDAATTLATLPCPGSPGSTATVANSTATYSTTVSYVATYTATTPIVPTPTACATTPTAWPGMAEIKSVGKAAKGASVTMAEDVQTTAPAPSNSAFADADYSPTQISFVTTTINKGANPSANVVSGGPINCTNATTVQGSVLSYSTSTAPNLNNNCTITNDLDVADNSGFTLYGATVGGKVLSTGSGAMSLASLAVAGNIDSTGPLTIQGGTTGGSLYATSPVTLNATNVAGSSYSTGGLTLQSSAVLSGSGWGSGAFNLNASSITGSANSYTSGSGVFLYNSTIGTSGSGGGALATGPSSPISVQGSSTVWGGAHASGAITYNTGGMPWLGTINGTVNQNDSTLTNTTLPATDTPTIPAMPTAPTWPQLTYASLTPAAWAAKGYANYITVPAASCATYFTYSGGSTTPFLTAVNAALNPTVIDASACTNVNVDGPANTETFSLNTNIALVVNGLFTSAYNVFQSSSSTMHDLSIIVPYGDSGNVTLNNTTTLAGSLSTFIYVGGGQFNANSSPMLTGQILSYGQLSASSGSTFVQSFNTAAGLTVPGVAGTGGGASVSVAAIRRYTTHS